MLTVFSLTRLCIQLLNISSTFCVVIFLGDNPKRHFWGIYWTERPVPGCRVLPGSHSHGEKKPFQSLVTLHGRLYYSRLHNVHVISIRNSLGVQKHQPAVSLPLPALRNWEQRTMSWDSRWVFFTIFNDGTWLFWSDAIVLEVSFLSFNQPTLNNLLLTWLNT